MNIESRRAEELVGELTALTRETPAEAVLKAVEERLARERRRRADLAALQSIARDFQKAAPPGLSSDHSFLYDEDGLPT